MTDIIMFYRQPRYRCLTGYPLSVWHGRKLK